MQDDISNRIFFEDEYLAVLYKVCGEDSQDFFKSLFKNKKYAQAVNRLDKPVSGLLIISFNKNSHTKLSEEFRQNKIQKEYWAICKKTDELIAEKKLYCEHQMFFDTKKQKAFISEENQNSKKAKLFYSLAGTGENYNFLRVFPVTGRTHQIRAQLAYLGMPIKGDIKYGSKRTEKLGGIRLHSYSIEFIHPIIKELLKITAPPIKPDTLWLACTEACLKNAAQVNN